MKNLPKLFSVLRSGLMLLSLLTISIQTSYSQFAIKDHIEDVGAVHYSLAHDAQGNTYVSGKYHNTITLGSLTLTGGPAGYLAKMNSTGTYQWVQQLSFPYGGLVDHRIYDMTMDGNGLLYITGIYKGQITFGSIILNSTTNSSGPTADIFVAKLDGSGNYLWAKSFGSGTGDDESSSVNVDDTGNVYFTGSYFKKPPISGSVNPQEHIYIAKLNSSGTLLWEKTFGNSNKNVTIYPGGEGRSISTDPDHNVLVAARASGTFNFGNGVSLASAKPQVFILKFNAIGTAQWGRMGASSTYDEPKTIYADDDSNVYTGGGFHSNLTFGAFTIPYTGVPTGFLVKHSPNGSTLWAINPGTDPNSDAAQILGIIPRSVVEITVADIKNGVYAINKNDGTVTSWTDMFGNANNYTSPGTTGVFSILDLSGAGEDFTLSVFGYCGEVMLGSLPIVVTNCLDCNSGWTSCGFSDNKRDLFIIRTGDLVSCNDSDSDGICDSLDICPEFNDNLIGLPCDDGLLCTQNDVYTTNCLCEGQAIPDCICEYEVTWDFTTNPLNHIGSGFTSTDVVTIYPGGNNIRFDIFDLNAVTGGNPGNRFIDLVKVRYVDEYGATILHGTYSGAQVSQVSVTIAGFAQSIWVTLEDGYDGNSSTLQEIHFSEITYCHFGGLIVAPEIDERSAGLDGKEDAFGFDLFPNPAHDLITINFNKASKVESLITLSDALGHELLSTQLPPAQQSLTISLNKSRFPAGLYFVSCLSDKQVLTKKFIVE